MKVAVIGSRSFNDYDLLKKTLDQYKNIELIVSGHAIGADSLGEKYAKDKGIGTLIFKPDWKKYGKAAGFIRNKDIIASSDTIVAFWDGESRGTANSISIAEKQGKKVIIVKFTFIPEQLPLHSDGVPLTNIKGLI